MNTDVSSARRAAMTSRSRRRIAAAALFATGCLLLAACGGGSNSSAAKPSGSGPSATAGNAGAAIPAAGGTTGKGVSDPCSMLTQAQVETAVGQPVGAGKQTAGLGMCTWSSSDFTAGVNATFSTWSAIKTAATSNGHTPASLSGIGDEALDNGPLLSVRKGDDGFLLVINGPTVDSATDHGLAQEKVLAAAILGHM